MTDKPTAFILDITFSGGQKFTLTPNEKIILVGPNNSGKSQSLRDILEIAKGVDPKYNTVVRAMTLNKTGSEKELESFLEENASSNKGVFQYKAWAVNSQHLKFWREPYLKNLWSEFIKKVDANERLNICAKQNSVGPTDQKSKPQHVLYDDSTLMEKISGHFRSAFGKDIMFDFRGGKVIPIHVGELPDASLVDRVSDAYVSVVRENPYLDDQGDGMKSYAGILFETIVEDHDVTLLDEPEAFLHPPQMRRLGDTLASEVVGQLIVATHSSDIMRGFLEGTKGDVRILRIRRDGSKNLVAEASPETISELWSRPVLRYSNALDGVFHEQTIICEDDSDCRLINAVADHLTSNSDSPWPDTCYVPTGGKFGVPKVADVLRKIGVPIKAVFDIDFLADKSLVKDTVLAFGGNWDELETPWSRVDAAVRSGVKPKTNEEIKESIRGILDKSAPEALPKGDIAEALKQGKPWSQVKRFGEAGIPSGDAQKEYQLLREGLEKIGIYLVPVGELEGFCREIGLHGPKYVNTLLADVPLDDSKLDDLRTFVEKVHRGARSPLPDDPMTESVE